MKKTVTEPLNLHNLIRAVSHENAKKVIFLFIACSFFCYKRKEIFQVCNRTQETMKFQLIKDR
ncbi:protein of unknown function [Pseudodesulfovibrio profundus]|uniref:Uncharacterized protein n=1 Tax=Pseudodesulfovibrio profundus TaxID=57320 RepID=A0A2C8FCB5_9BACT|nr:protein of unknown function [Pseudodesulfovibrio profundus]